MPREESGVVSGPLSLDGSKMRLRCERVRVRVNYCKESTNAKFLTGNTAVTFLAVLA